MRHLKIGAAEFYKKTHFVKILYALFLDSCIAHKNRPLSQLRAYLVSHPEILPIRNHADSSPVRGSQTCSLSSAFRYTKRIQRIQPKYLFLST